MTIATPSAKSHERVSGRWARDFRLQQEKLKNPREWMIYYVKMAVGTPIPALICAYAALAFISRAGLELASWSCAILTLLYIFADLASSIREFRFFRIGGDLFLLGYLLTGLISASYSESLSGSLADIGGLRWVLLLYAIAYCWELFPGLNRVFAIMIGSGLLAAVYGIWQHFTGVDLIRGTELAAAPVPGAILFQPVSFFNTPEHFGTLLCLVLPFPFAAYLLQDRRISNRAPRYIALGIGLTFALAILWTYRPGMWIAGSAGILIAIIMGARHGIKLLLFGFLFVFAVLMVSYGSPDQMFSTVEQSERVRSERQRSQINAQVSLWEKSPWIGSGRAALEAAEYDPGTGNVYFQVLAQVGVFGAGFYLLFVLGFLLATYRAFFEIPQSHYWHRVLVSGSLAGQIAFHIAGLYWSTLSEALAFNLFVLLVAATSYLTHHYNSGIVTDDHVL